MADKAQIQKLISEGQTEEALSQLATVNGDALLLQSRYAGGKKQYSMGLIEFGDWQRVQNQINYAALEMANSLNGKTSTQPLPGATNNSAQQVPNQPSVFISYNHNDTFAMRSVKGHLEDEGIKVFVDIFEMKVGDDIQEFIDKALQENTIIVSLISKNSLVSGWVNVELSSAILLRKFGSKWIPARLDDSCFDDEFYFTTLESFEERTKKVRANIQRALNSNVDIRPFQDELSRLEDMKSSFGKIIEMIKKTLSVDISEKMFDAGMSKMTTTIQALQKQ